MGQMQKKLGPKRNKNINYKKEKDAPSRERPLPYFIWFSEVFCFINGYANFVLY
jgi:hypothetical protein